MSLPTRPLTSNLRQATGNSRGVPSNNAQSSALVARIADKKEELENLRELRDLSAGLAAQMQSLEQHLSTLADGTEAIAHVLANWHNVLRAIHMASVKMPRPANDPENPDTHGGVKIKDRDVLLPQTLVRIPTQSQPSPTLQEETCAGNDEI